MKLLQLKLDPSLNLTGKYTSLQLTYCSIFSFNYRLMHYIYKAVKRNSYFIVILAVLC